MVTIKSCKGVTIKKLNSMFPAPRYFITFAAFFCGIFFEKLIKNIAKLMERKIIPASAHILDGLSEPFTAFDANKLLIKFFVQSNPIEFFSNNEPPGYTVAAISNNETEIITPNKTEYFFSMQLVY